MSLLQRSHLYTAVECRSPSTRAVLGRRHNGRFLLVSAMAVRHNSSQIPSETLPTASPVLEASIPSTVVMDPASINTQPIAEQVFEAAPTVVDVLQGVGVELSLSELGLGSATPVGLVQNLLEFMHVDMGMPWWGAIVVGTVLARIMVFPVIVKGQREAAKLNNVMPEMTKFTNKMNEAKQSGNKFDFAKAYSDLTAFQKKHDVNPLRGFLVPLVQTPVFISFFIALRKMSHLPVPSMQTGGCLWFLDLTAADPFHVLPIAVTGTMFAILELGAESGVDNPNLKAMKTVFRIMPFIILPLTINFPTVGCSLISCAPCGTVPTTPHQSPGFCFSLAQVALLKHPLVRQKLRIPERIKHPASALPQNEGFIHTIKKGWKNAQLAQQLDESEGSMKSHLDITSKGPLRQTFTHNPLQKSTPSIAAATTTTTTTTKSAKAKQAAPANGGKEETID
ncbi:mitochondrial inner membrane protein OXA1L [Salmo salar]|uniref:Mitochondrial inner membrane protein OXA1L n=1 Tax=Salmo salar TaxID=8030 RepID=A0ABM3DCM3_SALSA|nr:mitochondrial inner membrane protein OXA1L-like [Salmo salar]